MRLSTPFIRPARTARRHLGAALATVVGASALAVVAPVPAIAASGTVPYACTANSGLVGMKSPTFQLAMDTNAPATMHVGDASVPVSLTTSVTMPGDGYVGTWYNWAKRQVAGPATFTTTGTTTSTSVATLGNATKMPIVFGSPANWTISGTGPMGSFNPTTPGEIPISVSSMSANYTWRDYFDNIPESETVACVPAGTQPTPVDTVRVVSRSTTTLTVNPASVPQNTPGTVQANVTVAGGTVNGTVRFQAGSEVVEATVGPTGQVTATLPVLPIGVHDVTAQFFPTDTVHYETSTSSVKQLEVKASRATTTTLALSNAQIAPTGFSIATATVAPATGSGTPVGSVRFTYNNTNHLVSLNPDGTASHTIANLPGGDYPVRATFVPSNANVWIESLSNSALLTVVKVAAVSTTTLAFTKNPALTTDTVSGIATVSIAGGAAATGSVNFTITGGPDGSVFETPPAVTVGAGGTASVDLSHLAAGPYEVLAEFTPTDSTDQTLSASANTVFTVNEPQAEPAVNTTTALDLDKTSAFSGESATATATVGAVSGPNQPVGSVVFAVNGTDRAPVALTNGTASLTLPNLAVGTYAVTARFVPADSALFNASGPTAPKQVTVTKRPAVTTSTVLDLTPSSITEDEDATATATVTAPSGTLAGDVSFAVTSGGDTTTHVRPYRAAGTSLVLTGLEPGSYSVVATFVPASTDDFTGSVSNTSTLTVTAAPAAATTTTLSVSRTHATTVQAVSATARVATGRGPVSGTVAFSYGATTITAPVVDGAATIDLVGLAIGVNTIEASFTPAADATGRFLPSSATSKTVTVTQASAAATVTSVTLSETTTAANAPVTAQIYVAGTGATPTGSVTLSFQGRTTAATALVGGAATITVPTKGDGTYDVGAGAVVAAYTPTSVSTTNASSGSENLSVTAAVGATHTSTTVSLDRSAIIVGETAVATANVAMAGSPAGSIVFGYRGVEQTVPLVAGSATLELDGVTAGNFPVAARFVPSGGTQAPSSAQSAMLSVSPVTAAPSSTSLSLSKSSIDAGESVTATAIVSSSQSTLGDVTFTVGAQSLSAAVDPDTGAASASLTGLPVGTHAVTATFVPDNATTMQGSSSTSKSVTVVATSAVNLSLSTATAVQGATVTASAAVTAVGGPSAGQVTFRVGGREVSAPVANGTATATLPEIAPGDYDVVASFAPAQAGMRSATSAARSLVVTKAAATTPPPSSGDTQTPAKATTLTLLASRASSAYGQPTSVVATAPAGVDGFVQFTVGGFSQDIPVQGGTATLTVPRKLPVGAYTVNATLVPTNSGAFRQSTASTSLAIVRDAAVVKFAKRWTPSTRTLQVRARVAGAFGSAGTGKVVFTLTQAPPKTGKGKKPKAVKISKVTGTLDANGVATVNLPTKGKLGTFKVKVAYAGSSTLLPSTLLKSLKIR